MYNGAGRIANAIDDNVLNIFVDTFCWHPDTFWKLTLRSPEAGTLSSPPSLLSSPRILFLILSEELISLSL